ncbi:MAG: cellulase family glycosylhydrolase [Spirochaetales bacterium]|nr:cellulase family glycosylhydrolase [Spirochaetales bacterium]
MYPGLKGSLPGIFLLLLLLGSCRSFTDSRSAHFNPEEHYPVQFGICQVGSMWPEDNGSFRSSPSAYETGIWRHYQETPLKLELFDQMGIQWWRSDFSWRHLEPMEGHWSFQRYDWLVEAAAENNKKVLALLVYDTPWLYGEENRSRDIRAGELEHYLNYARTMAERYGDRLGGFEIWNEPNFGRFWNGRDEDFFTLTKETVRVLKEAAPHVPVAVGALSYHPVTGGKSFLKKMIEAGALEGADAVSIHPYGASIETAARRVAELRTLLRDSGYDHRIWITEMGFPTTGLYPHRVELEDHYASTIEALTLMYAAGADLITWYKLLDSYNPEEAGLIVHSERSFGLMSRKKEWKPGAHAYALLARELQGKTYTPDDLIIEGDWKNSVKAFLFKEGDETAIVLWSRNPDRDFHLRVEGLNEMTITGYDPLLQQTAAVEQIPGDYPVVITGTGGGIITLK